MNAVGNPYLTRIVINPGVRSGRPCVRDTRITVQEILRWLASGATEEEILQDYPYLSKELRTATTIHPWCNASVLRPK